MQQACSINHCSIIVVEICAEGKRNDEPVKGADEAPGQVAQFGVVNKRNNNVDLLHQVQKSEDIFHAVLIVPRDHHHGLTASAGGSRQKSPADTRRTLISHNLKFRVSFLKLLKDLRSAVPTPVVDRNNLRRYFHSMTGTKDSLHRRANVFFLI